MLLHNSELMTMSVSRLSTLIGFAAVVPLGSIIGCTPSPTDGGDGPLFVESNDPGSPVAGFMEDSGGNVFAILGEKDSQGSTTRVTGAYYKGSDGSSWAVFLGADGLPDRLVVGEWVLSFNNYAGSIVDLTVVAPDGTTGIAG